MNKATEPGSELSSITTLITMEDMVLFAPEGVTDIHTNDEIAVEAGMPSAVTAGAQLMAFLFAMLEQEYGHDMVQRTSLDVRFRAPVFAGDSITAMGRVTAAEPDGAGRAIALDVWCQNQRGDRVVTGTARVQVALI